MTIKVTSTAVREMREVLLATELSGRVEEVYKLQFSTIGKGSWSFGICQWDIGVNTIARSALLDDLGATEKDVATLLKRGAKAPASLVDKINARMNANKWVVDQVDACGIQNLLSHVAGMNGVQKVSRQVPGNVALLIVADMANQFGIGSTGVSGGRTDAWLSAWEHSKSPNSDAPIAVAFATDFTNWKLEHTKWGRKHKKDVLRRAKEITNTIPELQGNERIWAPDRTKTFGVESKVRPMEEPDNSRRLCDWILGPLG